MKKSWLPILAFLFLFNACGKKQALTPREFALLSAHVYDDKELDELPTNLEPFLDFDKKKFKPRLHIDIDMVEEMVDDEDWTRLIPYVGFKALSRGGYFGRAYVNEKNNQLIIAHRGTDLHIKIDELSKNHLSLDMDGDKLWDILMDMDDDYDIFKGKIPMQQLESALYFQEAAKEKFIQQYNREPIIIHTGHSLGAVLAELCAVKNNNKAITFESPGSKPLAEQLKMEEAINWEKLDITTYNAEPNSVNTLHEHLGQVIPLYKPSEKLGAYSEEDLVKGLQGHPIKELLKRFDTIDN